MHATRATQRPRPPVPDDDWALVLDVDGCLLDFADAPDKVVVPLELRERLFSLSQRLDGALALVSGRSLQTLDDLFWPLRLPAAGMHGVERRSKSRLVRAPGADLALRRLCAEAGVLALRHPGTIVENKHAGFALHWRAAPDAEPALRAFAEAAVERLPGHRLQLGNHVAEVLPADGDKGRAIEEFLAEAPFAGRFPVYAGDDLTDEAAFRAINARDGASVLVGGRGDSAARFALPDPAAVRAWLDMAAAGDGRSVAQART
jgi:trehalose 6-phosphate phosphatase